MGYLGFASEVTNEVWAGEEEISVSVSDSDRFRATQMPAHATMRFRATRDMAQMPAHEHLESTNTWKAEEPICYNIPTHLFGGTS